MSFHEKVRDGYLELAADEPGRFRIFDGQLPAQELSTKIVACVMKELTKSVPHPGRLTFERGLLE